jgi:hypothetical protein
MFSDDATILQKTLIVLMMIVFVPIGVNDTIERFGGASNTVIMLISIIIVMTLLSISLTEMSLYTVLKVAFIASILNYLLIDRGVFNPDDHWLEIIATFILIGVLNLFYDMKKGD